MVKVLKMFFGGEAADSAASLYNRLPQQLKAYVDKKQKGLAKNSTLGCYLLLEKALCGTDFSLCDLYYEKSGKPQINGMFLSFSHKDNLCVCAVSDKPVGVDAERVRQTTHRAVRKFTPEEMEYANKSDQNFYEIWTKKESASKLLGGGIKELFQIDTLSKTYKFNTEKTGEYIITVCEIND